MRDESRGKGRDCRLFLFLKRWSHIFNKCLFVCYESGTEIQVVLCIVITKVSFSLFCLTIYLLKLIFSCISQLSNTSKRFIIYNIHKHAAVVHFLPFISICCRNIFSYLHNLQCAVSFWQLLDQHPVNLALSMLMNLQQVCCTMEKLSTGSAQRFYLECSIPSLFKEIHKLYYT